MTRLREEPCHDPELQAGHELLRRVPSTAPSPEMKRRVWAAMAAGETRPAFAAPARRRLPVMVTVVAVVFAAGTAGAVIAHRYFAPALRRAAMTTPDGARPAPPPRKTAPLARPAAVRAELPVVTPPPTDLDVPAPLPRPSANRSTRRTTQVERVVVRPSGDSVTAPATPRERAEVLDAMIVLRRDHDAVRAGQLLDRYLTARPHGALREEALALAIEAAAARGDQASVSSWARTYQADYPTGRFAAFARSYLKTP